MTDPVATAEDVSSRIPTGLEVSEINTYLEDAVFDLGQIYTLENEDNDWRMQVEWRLTAYKILTLKEKETVSESRQSVNLDYAESRIEVLRKEIENLTDGQLPEKESASFEVF